MARTTDKNIEMIEVELNRDDVRLAIIEAARDTLPQHHYKIDVDDKFVPQLVEDGFGGFKVYFRKAEPKKSDKAA